MPAMPKVLVIEPRDDLYSDELGFIDNLRDLAAEKFDLDAHTWTDALMKYFPPEYQAVLLDGGRIGDFELDVI